MNEEIFEKYREAGAIASKILHEGAQNIRIGESYLNLVESVESRILEEGASIAFPLNVSINEDANISDLRKKSKGADKSFKMK